MTNKILVVDDEPDLEFLIQQKFRQQIKKNEFEFVFAGNGIEALQIIKKDPDIAIMLTDINMPKMDGLTLLAKVAELKFTISSVIVSAYGDMKNIRKAMNLGAFDFLLKPMDLTDLEITIKKTLKLAEKLQKSKEQEQDIRAAWKIQKAILPTKMPEIPGLDIHAEYIPMAGIGGDFYDFIEIEEKKLGVLIADVSGHGASAALVASMLKIAFSLQNDVGNDPIRVLENLNKILSGKMHDAFLTACYVYIDMEKMDILTAKAAHPPVLVWKKNQQQLIAINPTGHLIGWFPMLDCGFERTEIEVGDRILLYTDGITESFNKDEEMFGDERFEALIRENEELSGDKFLQKLNNTLGEWTIFSKHKKSAINQVEGKKYDFEDDITIVVIDVV